ncbi:DUF3010 family protein [Kiloniella laminariae]|uniref:DUF3010 family protein n=1 Tax=Kiloniella laminariae TaxID=454162 RepID=A0ABT4LGQ7_9PROT|nr:DUF3010 family protein [Kiloniella laminariae]MCZ4280283.1 DUF3010 family protein [Kiloniella laminariae]
MKVCGVELKGNEAILVLLQGQEACFELLDHVTRKITLKDSDCAAEVSLFRKAVDDFMANNRVEKILIKKRAKKGKFAGGPDTFKMEALIQIISGPEVVLVSPQALATMEKKRSISFPAPLLKYQQTAFLAGVWGLVHI